MRKIFGTAATAALICLVGVSASLGQTINGTLAGDSYGSALAVQTIETGFGDNQNEWNAAYSIVSPTMLSLMFTGNLEGNFNKLEIFIDSTNSGTTNVYSNPQNNDGTAIMNGMTFDSGFTPDYHIIARHGDPGGGPQFDLDFIDLANQTFSNDTNIFGGFSTGIGVGTNTGIAVGFDNSNAAGIGGTAGMAADQAAALAVQTGLELGISLAAIGNPTGPIRIMLLQNNNNHDFLSNQTLGGLPVGTGNLGTPASAVNFDNIAGNQYFTTIPEPAAAGMLGLLSMTGLLIRRRK
jgi:hypothetical protein